MKEEVSTVEKTGAAKKPAETEKPVVSEFKLGLGIRLKLTLTFFIFISLVSLFMAISINSVLNKELFKILQNRVKSTAQVGSMAIDRNALEYLLTKVKLPLTKEEVASIERSKEYKKISDQLNAIRQVDRGFFRYAYLLVVINENKVIFLVDADVLKDLARIDSVPGLEISHFGSDFYIDNAPNVPMVMKTKQTVVGDKYYYDRVFKFNALSAFSPIFSNDGKRIIALLGLDSGDTEIQGILGKVQKVFIVITIVSLGVALLIALILGGMFTAGIRQLDAVAQHFANNRLDVRADIQSRDEVGHLGFTFNIMAQSIQNYSQRLKAILFAYEKFVPHDFLELLQKKSILDIKLGDQVQREMTILFADMRGFTSLSEKMTPKENFDFINEYLSYISPEIRSHHGFIDKYVGDAIMALFPKQAEDAVQAALSMMKKLELFNQRLIASDLSPIKIGIGIHIGKTMLGTVGEEARMDGTVISDAVNISSRLESLSKKYGAQILISKQVFECLSDPNNYQYRFLDNIQVKGKILSVAIYEIFDSDPLEQRKNKIESQVDFQTALSLYNEGKVSEALSLFEQLQARYPQDKLFEIYVTYCQTMMKNQ